MIAEEQLVVAGREHLEPMAYRIPDACQRLQIGTSTFYQLVSLGLIKTIRIGARSMISRDEMNRILIEGAAFPEDMERNTNPATRARLDALPKRKSKGSK